MSSRIVIFGAPGAGKGTQARRIGETHGLPHISTGDIFRDLAKKKSELGVKVEVYLKKGQLVPDELVCEVVAERLGQTDCKGGYILDGFPRSLPQAEAFDRLLDARGEALDVAIELDVPEAEIVGRLVARRTCPKCGRIYNLQFDPPKREGLCDEAGCDGAELAHRDDDREDTIRDRLHVYQEMTRPTVEFYADKGLRMSVEGAGRTPDDIAQRIEEILKTAGVV